MSKAEKHAYKKCTGNIHYFFLVRSLLFVIQTQSDIQFVVNLIIQFGGNLDITYLEVLYAKSTCLENTSL